MNSTAPTESELARLLFSAKAAAYVSPMTIKDWQGEGRADFVLVDVRKRHPQPLKKITGALWLPQPEVAERWADLPKDKLIVLYCWETWCSLATSAALVLLEHGYQVKELYGGIGAWETLRLPVEELPAVDSVV
ncbi:MAG: rhodanese-like domain-containing protein [Xanthobacteraceae bacterium]|nr:rhodanese-like domain-containing protein [Xanthobacteraceae bacterium]